MVRFILRFFIFLVILFLAGLAYALWPRQADLRNFDPQVVAHLETGMWRDYYDHDYKMLARRLYALYRKEYHFSPADSAQLTYAAASAAELFQPTTSRADAQIALPPLTRYYTLLRAHGGESFDPDKAARLELDWWQLRRENATPVDYGEVVTQVTEELFGIRNNDHLKQSGLLRAQMMRYRDDRREGRMLPEDWTHIEQNLTVAYRELKEGVTRAGK